MEVDMRGKKSQTHNLQANSLGTSVWIKNLLQQIPAELAENDCGHWAEFMSTAKKSFLSRAAKVENVFIWKKKTHAQQTFDC